MTFSDTFLIKLQLIVKLSAGLNVTKNSFFPVYTPQPAAVVYDLKTLSSAIDKHLNIHEWKCNLNKRMCAFDLLGLGAQSSTVQLI